jgi:hypothetical protein
MAYTTILKFEGKVSGAKEVSFALGRAPELFEQQLIRGLLHEKNLFVGSKKGGGHGVFGRKLERRALWGGRINKFGSTWSSQMLGQFKGWTSGRGLNTQLQMGVLYNKRKQIHEALEALSTGMQISGVRNLVVPMYKNIQNIKGGGEYVKMSSAGAALSRWGGAPGTTSAEGLVRIQHGNKTYWYDRKTLNEGRPLSALVFISKPSVSIKKQFDFEGDWKKREPKAIERIKGYMDKATQAVNEGKYKI